MKGITLTRWWSVLLVRIDMEEQGRAARVGRMKGARSAKTEGVVRGGRS